MQIIRYLKKHNPFIAVDSFYPLYSHIDNHELNVTSIHETNCTLHYENEENVKSNEICSCNKIIHSD